MRFAFIDAGKEVWPVEFLCRVMQVTSRGFRAWKVRPMSQRQRDDMVILAHIMVEAVQSLWPGTKTAIGPAIEHGFYGDFDRETPFTPENLTVIEKKVREIVAARTRYFQETWAREQAKSHFQETDELWKLVLLDAIPESAQNYGLAAQAMGGMAEPAEQPTALSGLMRACKIPAQLPADCAEITPEALAHEMKNEANIGMAENAACQITDSDTDEISALMMDLLKTSAAQREGRPVNEQGTSLAMECD